MQLYVYRVTTISGTVEALCRDNRQQKNILLDLPNNECEAFLMKAVSSSFMVPFHKCKCPLANVIYFCQFLKQ